MRRNSGRAFSPSHRAAPGRAGGPVFALVLACCFSSTDTAWAAPPLYWCPGRTADQQYAATAEPGCQPLVDEKDRDRSKGGVDVKGRPIPPLSQIPVEQVQSQTGAFLREYRSFLDCCADNPDYLGELGALEDKATAILLAAQDKLFSEHMKMRGFTLQELVPPVARAREDLRKLRMRFKNLDAAYDRADTLGYEEAAKEKRRIQEEEANLKKEFQPSRPPEAPRTGSDISTIVGSGPTSLPNRVGTGVGSSTLPSSIGTTAGSDQSRDLKPRVGTESQVTTLPNQTGTVLNNSTLPSSTGFELGGDKGPTGSSSLPSRAGPSVGDSSLNRR